MQKRKVLGIAGLLACCWLGTVVCAAQPAGDVVILGGADEKPVVTARYMDDEVEIGVGGVLMLRIRASAVGYSPAERARIVDARMVHVLSYGELDPEAVEVVMVRSVPTVYVGDIRLISVYPSDVEAAGAESAEGLAKLWAASVACCLRSLAPWARVAP